MKQRRCLGGTLLSYKPLNRVLTGPEKNEKLRPVEVMKLAVTPEKVLIFGQ